MVIVPIISELELRRALPFYDPSPLRSSQKAIVLILESRYITYAHDALWEELSFSELRGLISSLYPDITPILDDKSDDLDFVQYTLGLCFGHFRSYLSTTFGVNEQERRVSSDLGEVVFNLFSRLIKWDPTLPEYNSGVLVAPFIRTTPLDTFLQNTTWYQTIDFNPL